MILLVDGYNLLKYIIKKDFATEKERNWLISELTEYARTKNHSIIVVFDGGPYERPTYTKRGQVAILYSGARQSADDVIKEYISHHTASQLLIVSSDRGLYSFASRARIATVDAEAFYVLMREKKQPLLRIERTPGKAQKLRPEKRDPELDALMQEGSEVLMYKDGEGKNNSHTKTAQKLSKEERKLLKITKKL